MKDGRGWPGREAVVGGDYGNERRSPRPLEQRRFLEESEFDGAKEKSRSSSDLVSEPLSGTLAWFDERLGGLKAKTGGSEKESEVASGNLYMRLRTACDPVFLFY